MRSTALGGSGRRHPTVHIPPSLLDDAAPTAALLRLLYPRDLACDEFRMYEFKVRRCARGRSHDWTECPYAHPGEKARRRDPRRFHYSGTPCPDFRRGGGCRRGDACELAHGVFESWLHPERYRTQPCKDGAACGRRVCFFAHTPEQLRVVVPPSPASPGEGSGGMSASPTSTLLPPADGSPPVSPVGLEEVALAMRRLQLSKAKSAPPFGTRRGRALLAALGSAVVTPVAVAEEGEEWEEEETAAAAWSLKAKLVEGFKREEEAALPDLGWVWELVKD